MTTQPYPDNDRSEWHKRSLVSPHYETGLCNFAYEIFPNQQSMDSGDKPFLLNSHKSQVRENHQRIIVGPNGGMMHVSGVEVLDAIDFMLNATEAFRWVTTTDLTWEDDRGRTLAPFRFPSYAGVVENLDPQWQREQFVLAQDQQIAEILNQYDTGAMAQRLSGDRRGTTLDLQIGASTDDCGTVYGEKDGGGWVLQSNALTSISVGSSYQTPATNTGGGFRFTSATIPVGATIDTSYAIFKAKTGSSNTTVNSRITGSIETNPATWSTLANYQARRGTVVDGDNDANITTAQVAFDSIAAWSDNVDYNSPSINTIVQEIIDTAGWASGNSTVIYWDDHAQRSTQSNSIIRVGHSYDNDSSKAAKLHVEYTPPPFTPRAIMF